jgi:hypothetical protein
MITQNLLVPKISEALFQPHEIVFIHFHSKFQLVTNQLSNFSVANRLNVNRLRLL